MVTWGEIHWPQEVWTHCCSPTYSLYYCILLLQIAAQVIPVCMPALWKHIDTSAALSFICSAVIQYHREPYNVVKAVTASCLMENRTEQRKTPSWGGLSVWGRGRTNIPVNCQDLVDTWVLNHLYGVHCLLACTRLFWQMYWIFVFPHNYDLFQVTYEGQDVYCITWKTCNVSPLLKNIHYFMLYFSLSFLHIQSNVKKISVYSFLFKAVLINIFYFNSVCNDYDCV